jgi:hypothetical protein
MCLQEHELDLGVPRALIVGSRWGIYPEQKSERILWRRGSRYQRAQGGFQYDAGGGEGKGAESGCNPVEKMRNRNALH